MQGIISIFLYLLRLALCLKYFGKSSMGYWEECILCCHRMQYSVDIS
jgi:hypothetical protein